MFLNIRIVKKSIEHLLTEQPAPSQVCKLSANKANLHYTSVKLQEKMEINDIDEPFVEKEWIGQRKKYDWAKLPAFVTNARREIMAISQNFYHSSGLPNPNLSIIEFFSSNLPHISAELISGNSWQKKALIRRSGQNFEKNVW